MPQTSFATDAHPTPDQLADFGRGTIDETLAETSSTILPIAPLCVRKLEVTHSDDPWIALLRGAGATRFPECRRPGPRAGI